MRRAEQRLIHILEKVEQAHVPLSAFADASFTYTSLSEGNEQSGNFRGALTENYVLNELLKKNRKPYFWRSGNTAELDFVVEDKGRVMPGVGVVGRER